MQSVPLNEAFVQGAVSVERQGDVLWPWRLPHPRRHLFPSPQDSLLQKARCTSGVRLRFETDAPTLGLCFEPLPASRKDQPRGHAFDVVVNNKVVRTVHCPAGTCEALFQRLGRTRRVMEIWLPPGCPVGLRAIRLPARCALIPLPDRRPLWVTWGSSLTHCVRAGSAACTWPAIVARQHNLNLINLGFGGDCHLEPAVAMVIRDLPASYISLKLGINAVGRSLNQRTYPALVTAAVAIIREKQPHTPLALISPMASPPRERTPGAAGHTLEGMRTDMQAVQAALSAQGDLRLYYVSGLDFFGLADIRRYAADQVHPNAVGMELQAERFSRLVMPLLLGAAAGDNYKVKEQG